MILVISCNFSFFLLEHIEDTCKIADMAHKMNKQKKCEKMSNAELLGEVVSDITKGREYFIFLAYQTLLMGRDKLPVV